MQPIHLQGLMPRLRHLQHSLILRFAYSVAVVAAFFCVGLPGLCSTSKQGVSPALDPRHVDASRLGERIDISANWLFHPGDDASYASPTLDDSGWKIISTRQELRSFGFRDMDFGWYRLHAQAPPGAQDMVVAIEGTNGSYEVYANGVLLGASGKMPARWGYTQNGLRDFPIPQKVLAARQGHLTLALRFSFPVVGNAGRGLANPLSFTTGIFLQSADGAALAASYSAAHLTAVVWAICGLSLVVGLVALGLSFALRTQREYLAAAVSMLTNWVCLAIVLWQDLHTTTPLLWWMFYLAAGVSTLYLIEFSRLVMRVRLNRGLLALEIAAAVCPFFVPLASSGSLPYSLAVAGYALPLMISGVVLPWMLFRSWRRGNRDAGMLFLLLLLSFSLLYFNFLTFFLKLLHALPHDLSFGGLPMGSYTLGLADARSAIFPLGVLLFLVLRTVRLAREQARVAGEIEAARTMQRLLLAPSAQPTPGFAVETVYYPASDVGGDFFLVSPGSDGSLTAIVGDVSGKGLLAAMRVSMILGVLRREESCEPGAVLRGLNKALLTQGELGFTTACCVRLERSGKYTVANAGHIAPYVDGIELETAPALPLGIAEGGEYAESEGWLKAGQQLVLLSDGVLEARSAKGELYGFDRLGGLTLKPAIEIAETAQNFGQEDDITVLTIACSA